MFKNELLLITLGGIVLTIGAVAFAFTMFRPM